MRIIPRGIELELIEKSGPWKMIYGRRKTGKSFLVENFLKYDRFFFVNRDSTVMDKFSMEKYNWNEFLKVFRELLGVKKIV
ncbi:MAG: ATPase, partial [Candidatus Methanomethylicia archaeon]